MCEIYKQPQIMQWASVLLLLTLAMDVDTETEGTCTLVYVSTEHTT